MVVFRKNIVVEFRNIWKVLSLGMLIYLNVSAWCGKYASFFTWDLESKFSYFLFSMMFLGIQVSYIRFSKKGWRSGVKIFNKTFEKESLIPWDYKYLDVVGVWPFYGISFITYIAWHWNFFFKNFSDIVVFIDEEISCDSMDLDARANIKRYADKHRVKV